MLSGETAAGSYPYETVKTMDSIARQTEEILLKSNQTSFKIQNISEGIGHAGNTIANDLNATAIITPTQTGITPRMISRFRPKALIVAATPFAATARSLALNWGVHTMIVPMSFETDELLTIAVTSALTHEFVKTGDIVVLTAGIPVGKTGATNMIKVQVVGNVLARGIGIGKKLYSGIARKEQDLEKFEHGDILIAAYTDIEVNPFLAKAGAIIVEEGGLTSYAAIAALQYGIPAVVGAENAMTNIKEGEAVTVDAYAGVVYEGIVNMI
jgi:pyruvate kinase